MATISFFLNTNKTDKNGLAPIILQFYNNKQRFKYYTGEKIESKYWSKSKHKPKPSYPGIVSLSSYLESLQTRILDIVRDSKTDGKIITSDFVKNEFLKSYDPKSQDTFFNLFTQYLENSKNTKTLGTIKNFNNALYHFNAYNNATGFDFLFENINSKFFNQFVDYLINKKKLSNNSIGKVIKILKTFLNWATENNYNKNLDYKKFKIWTEEIEIIYLTNEELENLFKLSIKNKSLEKIRDLFCFGCYTGLRFGDIAQIKEENIFNDEIHLRTQKTKDILVIPLLPNAKKILQKYDNILPMLSNQKFNKYLKDLGKLAELNQYVKISKYRGKTRIDTTLPKHELLTTHTARRTFITLSLEKGVRPEVIMSITGHKDYKAIKPYIKIVDPVKKNELLNAWHK